jgi:hypothetical protein
VERVAEVIRKDQLPGECPTVAPKGRGGEKHVACCRKVLKSLAPSGGFGVVRFVDEDEVEEIIRGFGDTGMTGTHGRGRGHDDVVR